MNKKCFLLVISCALAFNGSTQDQNEGGFEGHFLGIQGNELLRQLLSFGDASLPDNPYFINYNYSNDDGNGLNVGFALQADKFNEQNGFNTVTTSIDNFSIRIGYEKRKNIGKNFFYGVGIDLLVDDSKNVTTSEDGFGSGNIRTESKISGWGLGPRFTINYKISDRLMVGTEANYYYKSLTEKFETMFDEIPSNNINDETDIKRFNFSVPSILWISVKL